MNYSNEKLFPKVLVAVIVIIFLVFFCALISIKFLENSDVFEEIIEEDIEKIIENYTGKKDKCH